MNEAKEAELKKRLRSAARWWGGLTLLFVVLAGWLAYDGWVSETYQQTKPEKAKMNRWMSPLALLLGVWAVRKGVKECREVRKKAAEEDEKIAAGGAEGKIAAGAESATRGGDGGDKPGGGGG